MMLHQNAQEFDDYLPRQEEVVFENGESEQVIFIQLVNQKVQPTSKKESEEEEGSDDEPHELKFKVSLTKHNECNVNISRKNLAIVTILPESEET